MNVKRITQLHRMKFTESTDKCRLSNDQSFHPIIILTYYIAYYTELKVRSNQRQP